MGLDGVGGGLHVALRDRVEDASALGAKIGGDLFRKLILWSVGLLAVLCTLVYLQSTPILGWML